MQTMTLNNAAKHFPALAPQILNSGEVINIATDEGNIIMISEESYNNLVLSLQVEANPEFKQSLLQGLHTPLSEFLTEEEVVW